MKRLLFTFFSILIFIQLQAQSTLKRADVLNQLNRANRYWQTTNEPQIWSFWDIAAYHTGNMYLYDLTKNGEYLKYSEDWAKHNQWTGAKSVKKENWKYSYGEKDDYVLFGDWQICFQTYIDLYNLDPQDYKIARAKEVMKYQMSTPNHDYWWWADGLYMVMPVMTKMYKLTNDQQYLDKLHIYLAYADSIMYDGDSKLYYRDAKYVYPKHKTVNGKKDFWARGDGWVFAAYAKILQDLPKRDKMYKAYKKRFVEMANAIVACQQTEGYWTRSLFDPIHAPGPESSGTSFFTYGLLWGINNGILKGEKYKQAACKGWDFLSEVALQENGRLGYVQPIGEKAIPGQIVNEQSTASFGVGAFLLAGVEMYKSLKK